MRALTLTLFILGFVWAYLCLGLLGIPIMLLAELFTSTYRIPTAQFIVFAPICLLVFANTIAGYWFWINWIRYTCKREFMRVNESSFWKYSYIHHFAWIILLPYMYNSMNVGPEDSAARLLYWPGGLDCWPFLTWPLIVGILSLSLFLRLRHQSEAQASDA